MENSTENSNKCWWCGNLADTAEHIYKKTDLEREFGKKKEFIKNSPVKFKDQSTPTISIESSKSRVIKFPKNLCSYCNNIRSQPHDYAYDKFVDYFKSHEDEIYQSQTIDMSKIYCSNWKVEFSNLLKYFVKNFCCRIYELNIEIYEDVKLFLDDKSELETLKIRIYLRKDIYQFLKIADTGCLHLGGISYTNAENKSIETTTSYRSLTIGFFYSKEIKSPYWEFIPNPNIYIPIWKESSGYE